MMSYQNDLLVLFVCLMWSCHLLLYQYLKLQREKVLLCKKIEFGGILSPVESCVSFSVDTNSMQVSHCGVASDLK